MFNDKSKEDVAREALVKAEALEDLVKHPGWKILEETAKGLIGDEIGNLAGQKLDPSYYKKIGFLQALNFIKSIDSVIKDKEVRNYLLSQGRILGYQTFLKIPQYFFEGRAQSLSILNQPKSAEEEAEKKEKFIKEVYSRS